MEDTTNVFEPRRSHARRSMGKWHTVVFAAAKATGIFLLPSPLAMLFDPEVNQVSVHHILANQTAYLDGVRGLAATVVFIEHFGLPFYPGIVGLDSSKWSYLQLPIIRLFYHGSFAVCVFFVISGFVLSRKVIRLERQASDGGLTDQIHHALGSAAFRRAPRLFIPPMVIVLLIAGLAFFFDAFATAAQFPGLPRELYRLDVPQRLPTFAAQLADSFDFIISQLIYPFPWMRDIPRQNGSARPQTYGFHLWTIPVEFWSSEILFVVLMATSLRRRRVRTIVVILALSYSAWCGRWEPPLFLAGALLADLDVSREIAEEESLAVLPCSITGNVYNCVHWPDSWTCLGFVACVAGLWIGSMPDYNAARTVGFRALASLYTIPNAQVYWQGMGAVLFVWSLQHCRWLRCLFESSGLQYLGNISFALYLVHVPIVTTFGWAIAHFFLSISGKEINAHGWDREVLILIGGLLTFAVATWIADIFWRALDAPVVRLSKHLEFLSRLL